MVQVRKKNGCAEKMALGLGVCRYWVFVGDCFDFRFQAPGRRFAFIAEQDTILIYTFQDCLSRSVIGPVSMKMKSGVYSQPSPYYFRYYRQLPSLQKESRITGVVARHRRCERPS